MIRSSEMCEEFDPTEGMPASMPDCDKWLLSQGWIPWNQIGDDASCVRVWHRQLVDSKGALNRSEWMIEFEGEGGQLACAVRVPDLPTVLDLLARWGQIPVLQKAYEILTADRV